MRTRVLMPLSAAAMAAVGLIALFLPQEIRSASGAAQDARGVLLLQTAGALYLIGRSWMPILQLSAPELKTLLDGGQPLALVDVRTAEEADIARIEGARLLDQQYYDELLARDRDILIVFQCHHGIRSQSAAEYFQAAGFRNLYNLQGGIDAWSRLVDPSVARY